MENELTPFCNRRWKPLAVVLGLACFATFMWGFHMLTDYSEWKSETEYIMSGGPWTAQNAGAIALDQLNSVVRKTVVSVGGAGAEGPAGQPQVSIMGSGVIINPAGHLVTALHLVSNLPDIGVVVQTATGMKQYQAEIVKVVPPHNLALLKLISKDIFPFMAIGDSQALRSGETVYALGVAQGVNLIAKRGIVDRTGLDLNLGETLFTNMIKTDAVYRWSQSGGPLLNTQGIMVGLNIAVDLPGGGIAGYAVPSHIIVAHFQDMVQFMTATYGVGQMAAGPAVGSNPLLNRQMHNREAAEMEMGVNAAVTRAIPQQTIPSAKSEAGSNGWWQMARALIERQNAMLTQGFNRNENRLQNRAADFGINAALNTGQAAPVDTAHSGRWTLWGYSMDSIIGLLALGFVAGICGGAMTMGGGIVKVTGLMLFFGYGLILVRPVAYITNIFLYGSAALRYKRDDLIMMDKVRRLIPWAMGGVVLGYFLGNYLGSRLIQYMLGIFALLLGIKIVVGLMQSRGEGAESEEEIKFSKPPGKGDSILDNLVSQDGYIDRDIVKEGLLGVPMGIVSGILGISGGVVEVPLQSYVAKIPLKNAIANSSVMVFFASLVGSIVAMIHGVSIGAFSWETPLILALILTPGAYTGGMVGAWLTKTAPINVIKWVYAIFMFAIAIKMIF
jgi:uncharacterized membrane protein YfcA/S1-C subfamily serine protease